MRLERLRKDLSQASYVQDCTRIKNLIIYDLFVILYNLLRTTHFGNKCAWTPQVASCSYISNEQYSQAIISNIN